MTCRSPLRLAAYVAATVLLPMLAVVAIVVVVTDEDATAGVLGLLVAFSALAAVVAYSSLRVVHAGLADTLDAMSQRARAIAAGHVGRFEPIAEKGQLGVGELATDFNAMVAQVQRFTDQRDQSRDEFRRAITRFGEVLESSSDRSAILGAVLETAALVVGAPMVVCWTPRGASLRAVMIHGGPPIAARLARGAGVAGAVAASRQPELAIDAADGASDPEPTDRPAMAVPILAQNRLYAVLAVYGRDAGRGPYDHDDLATLTSLAGQARSAIDNTFLIEETARLSVTDGLTGLWNRRHVELRLRQELERSIRYGETFVLILADLDHFKAVNDTYGHPAGDAVLIEVARRFTSFVRSVDVVGRYGGEELVVLLSRTDLDGGARVAEKLRALLSDTPVQNGVVEIPVTASFGVASYPESAVHGDDLVAVADEALYLAKQRGRDRVERATPKPPNTPRNTT